MSANPIFAVAVAIALTLLAGANSTQAQTVPDAAPGTVRALYNPANGNLQVAVNGVGTWYIESLGNMTGATPTLPTIAGSLITDNDDRIGQSLFVGTMTYKHDLGNVAAAGLSASAFFMRSNIGFGPPDIPGLVEIVPEPASSAMAAAAILGLAAMRRRRA